MRASYEFAVMQLTRFRPVRGVLRTASTDSIVLLELRQICNTYRITDVVCSRQSGSCAEFDFPPSLRTSAHTGVAIRAPKAVAIVELFKISLSRPSPMGKVAALVLTEEEKT